jgi:hypothetical protein
MRKYYNMSSTFDVERETEVAGSRKCIPPPRELALGPSKVQLRNGRATQHQSGSRPSAQGRVPVVPVSHPSRHGWVA